MKKKMLIVALFVFLGSSTQALALSPFGPPKAGLDKGQYRIGLDYSYSEMELEFENGLWTEEIETSMVFANIGYGIFDRWEGFVRLGVAQVEAEYFEGGSEFADGVGTKVTLVDNDPISWGGIFQMGWFRGDDSIDGFEMEFDVYEIQIAFGPTYETENMRFYGGPFLHFVDGEYTEKFLGYSDSFDIEQKSTIGGFIGTQFDIVENTFFDVEFQFTGDAWALGLGIRKKF